MAAPRLYLHAAQVCGNNRTEGAILMKISMLAAILAAALAQVGCDMLDAVQKAQGRASPMAAPRSPDGYNDLSVAGVGAWHAIQSLEVAGDKGKFKFCDAVERFTLEPGENDKTLALYLPERRGQVETLIKQGRLPADRYYASIGQGVNISVPLADRTEIAKNIEAGNICIWSDVEAMRFDGVGATKGTIYNVVVSKWTGKLKVAPPPTAAPAADGAPTAPSAEK